MNRRTFLAATVGVLSAPSAGCVGSEDDEGAGNAPDDTAQGSTVDGSSDDAETESADDAETESFDNPDEPDAIFWIGEIRAEPPENDGMVYPSDHELLADFDPLEEVLDRIEADDEPSTGELFPSEQVRYGDDDRPTLEQRWNEIEADAPGGLVIVEHEDVYFELRYVEEFAN